MYLFFSGTSLSFPPPLFTVDMEQPPEGSFLQWLRQSPHALSFRDRDDLVSSAIKAHEEGGIPVSIVYDDLLALSSNVGLVLSWLDLLC